MENSNYNTPDVSIVLFFHSKLTLNQSMKVLGGMAKIEDFIDIQETKKEFEELKTQKKNISLKLEELLKNPKPCPFCGGIKVSFNYTAVRGHGDSGFSDLRVSCDNCNCSKGNVSNYGMPEILDKIKLLEEWNNRIVK